MSKTPEDWSGKKESCIDALDTSLAGRIASMLARPSPQEGDTLSPLQHWASFQIPMPRSGTGPDGDIAPGDFLSTSENNTHMCAYSIEG